MSSAPPEPLPDSEYRGLLRWLPQAARPFAELARFDRPIGWWLLFWPCAWGVLLAGGLTTHWPLLFWFLLGSIAMRGAGCVYNDIVDRDIDRQVARTRMRPVASGAVSVKAAWVWLVMLSLVGLIVLMQLNIKAQLLALGSLALVAAYPFMKRITWWPQAWLGLVFSWGALVGWIAVAEHARWAMAWLYLGSVFWVIGYDTIYALQDVEDDALIGVRSSARALGDKARAGVAVFYGLGVAAWLAAFYQVRPDPLVALPLAPVAIHLAWQVISLDHNDTGDALVKFRSNRFAGFLMAMGTLVVGATA
jgi:4-hydroxybenzoate polyprenyltransferase